MTAKSRQKPSLRAMKRALKTVGTTGIDRRTALGRGLVRFKCDLVASLGGESGLSAQESTIVELVCRERFLLDHVDNWLLQQPSLINRKRKSIIPIVAQRQQLADALSRHLAQLGLARREPKAPSLATYLRENYGAPANESQPDEQYEVPADEQNPPESRSDPIETITPRETKQ